MEYKIKRIVWCFSPVTKISEQEISRKWDSIIQKLTENKELSIDTKKEGTIKVQNKEDTLRVIILKKTLHIHLESKIKEKEIAKNLKNAYDFYLGLFDTINGYLPLSNLTGSIIILSDMDVFNGRDRFNEAIQFKKTNKWKLNGIKLSSDKHKLMLDFTDKSNGQFLFDESFVDLDIRKIIDETMTVLDNSEKEFKELIGS